MKAAAHDVVALGETMLSFVARNGTVETATDFMATHGGAETNALVALSRRGLRTAWVSRLGADPAGHRIRVALAEEGIDLRWVRTDDERPTGLMVRDTVGHVRYWRRGSAASALGPTDLDEVPVGDARAVLVSGITAMLGRDPRAAAIAFLERARGLRAVDPNLREGLWGSARPRDLLRPLIERCDVVLGSERELSVLVGGDGEEAARRVNALGPREVVVKRGAAGAAVLDDDGAWHEMLAPARAEVDPVGAGDAFNAGYLAARLSSATCSDALREACDAGAAAAAAFGDVPAAVAEPVADA